MTRLDGLKANARKLSEHDHVKKLFNFGQSITANALTKLTVDNHRKELERLQLIVQDLIDRRRAPEHALELERLKKFLDALRISGNGVQVFTQVSLIERQNEEELEKTVKLLEEEMAVQVGVH